MGLMDAISAEAKVELKVSELEKLMKNAAKADLIFNGIKADIPHRYMREIVTGEKEVDACDPEDSKQDHAADQDPEDTGVRTEQEEDREGKD